jgi:hypothetical protein
MPFRVFALGDYPKGHKYPKGINKVAPTQV